MRANLAEAHDAVIEAARALLHASAAGKLAALAAVLRPAVEGTAK